MTPTVSARAQYWNPLLWDYASKTIKKPYAQEQLGGQWVTFAAAWHPGNNGPQTFMSTEAWRLCTAPPIAPPGPAPSPVPPVTNPAQAAAAAMNSALAAHGYKQTDQPIYKAFQGAAGLKADGFPGSNTMHALAGVLQGMGQTIAPVKVYPWSSTGGYDGVNAPTLAEWQGAAPSPGAPSMQPSGPPGPVGPSPGVGAWQSNGAFITRYQSVLSYLAHTLGQPTWDPLKVDGKFGPNTQAAVQAFQAAEGLSPVDGKVGNATSTALDSLLSQTASAHH